MNFWFVFIIPYYNYGHSCSFHPKQTKQDLFFIAHCRCILQDVQKCEVFRSLPAPTKGLIGISASRQLPVSKNYWKKYHGSKNDNQKFGRKIPIIKKKLKKYQNWYFFEILQLQPTSNLFRAPIGLELGQETLLIWAHGGGHQSEVLAKKKVTDGWGMRSSPGKSLPYLKLKAKAHKNRPGTKRKVVFQTSIFRGYVSFREGKCG